MISNLTIDDKGKNNKIIGKPKTAVRSKITFYGDNGYVDLGQENRFFDLKIDIFTNSSIVISENSIIRGRIMSNFGATIKVGRSLICNFAVEIIAGEGDDITIGNDVLFSDVSIYSSDLHSIFDIETGERINPPKPVVIGDSVWLGRRVIVNKGVTIGSHSVVGAGSIVTKNIAPYSLAAGVPAKTIKKGITWSRDRLEKIEEFELLKVQADYKNL